MDIANYQISKIPWQLYITREINVATEHAMHEGWLEFTRKYLGKPLLKRVNIYRNGVANIFVSADDLKAYKAFINTRYTEGSLEDLYVESMAICKDVERWLAKTKKISYPILRKKTQLLAAPLVLPRLVELSLTQKPNWQTDTKIQRILALYSALNEYRRPLISERVYPLWARILPKAALFLLPNEIDALISGKLTPKQAAALEKRRYKRSAYITIDGKTDIITEDVDLLQNILQPKSINRPTTGKCASQGVVQGPCRVVIKSSDYQRIRKGDILVTPMTQPDIAPYMTKIAGLITDDGGVLCHAAVLSREYGIPCLTATAYATEVLKDGDDVLLDATRGYYKRMDV